MKKWHVIGAILLFFPVAALCDQPTVKSATITPTEVTPGDTVTMEIEFSGKTSDLKEVFFRVREFPNEAPARNLQPAKNRKGNVWVLVSEVPYEAPAQTYHLDVTAIDKDGEEIVTKGMEEQSTGKAASVTMKVTY